jgi:hypothetical protein
MTNPPLYTPGYELSPAYLNGLSMQLGPRIGESRLCRIITGPFDRNMQLIGSWLVTESCNPKDPSPKLEPLIDLLYKLTDVIFSEYPVLLPKGLHNTTILQPKASHMNLQGQIVLGDNLDRLESNVTRALLTAYSALLAIGQLNLNPKPKVWVSQPLDMWRATIQIPAREAIQIYPSAGKL